MMTGRSIAIEPRTKQPRNVLELHRGRAKYINSVLTFLACSLGRHCSVIVWLALMSVHEMFAKFRADLWAALAECQARSPNIIFGQ